MPVYNGKQEPYETNYTLNTILHDFTLSRLFSGEVFHNVLMIPKGVG